MMPTTQVVIVDCEQDDAKSSLLVVQNFQELALSSESGSYEVFTAMEHIKSCSRCSQNVLRLRSSDNLIGVHFQEVDRVVFTRLTEGRLSPGIRRMLKAAPNKQDDIVVGVGLMADSDALISRSSRERIT